MDFYRVEIKTGPLTVDPLPLTGRSGADVSFLGIVRADEKGLPIRGIDYEAHPRLARHWLETVTKETLEKFPVSAFYLVHAVGFVPAGKVSLSIQVQAPHRKAAFDACQQTIDELKRRVPIWKNPISSETASR